jgi:hypothetical protein
MAKRTTDRAASAASKALRSGRTASKTTKAKATKAKATKAVAAKALANRGAVVAPTEQGWSVRKSAARRGTVYPTQAEAIAAARALAEGGRVVVHERSGSLTEEVLTALLGTGDLSGGSRTTLRVPATLEREVAALSKELGLTKNDALVRLAFAGSQLVDRARETARKRESRRAAVFASAGSASGDLPTVEEMQEAALALRNGDD